MDFIWAGDRMADSAGNRGAPVTLSARIMQAPPPAAMPKTIFAEDWWLDAAAPGAWDRVAANWDGEQVGEMTFHLTKKFGLRYLGMPHLTRTMSPRLSPPSSKPATQRLLSQAIVGELVAKLPRHDRFERALEPDCPSVQGFVHQNFAVTHMFTFRAPATRTPESILRDAHYEVRRSVNKARRECSVERTHDLDRFIRLHRQAYGKASLVRYATLERLFSEAAARGQAEILMACMSDKRDVASMILLWDSTTVYTWLLARDGSASHSGASSLLSYEALRFAFERNRSLDLDGYVTPPVGEFLTKFGLQPVVRPYVNASSRLWQALRGMTTVLQPKRIDRHYRVG